ncbi:unnamed protein product [Blepharisma stoltei]|uniref:U-box domain-containing protein n=1 Tax=Blepharisma stoltei TaxID=1481888 RepID=A0AAU9JHH4_9CILI|nr:unnamed protein product [Blepharisma stoltei]
MVESFIDIPDDYCCPITGDLMEDPVVAPDGQSYDRASITAWFQRNKTSPLTGATLKNTFLIENHRLKSIISSFKEKMPEIQRECQIKRDLLEAIKSREAFVEDRLKKEEEKYVMVNKQYNVEKEKNLSLENELASCKEEILLLRKQLNESRAANKTKDEEIKKLKEKLPKAQNTLEENKAEGGQRIKPIPFIIPKSIRNDNQAKIPLAAQVDIQTSNQPKEQIAIWICHCGNGNDIGWDICASCYSKKPGLSGWVCQICKYKNDDNIKVCIICNTKSP